MLFFRPCRYTSSRRVAWMFCRPSRYADITYCSAIPHAPPPPLELRTSKCDPFISPTMAGHHPHKHLVANTPRVPSGRCPEPPRSGDQPRSMAKYTTRLQVSMHPTRQRWPCVWGPSLPALQGPFWFEFRPRTNTCVKVRSLANPRPRGHVTELARPQLLLCLLQTCTREAHCRTCVASSKRPTMTVYARVFPSAGRLPVAGIGPQTWNVQVRHPRTLSPPSL